MTQTIVDASVAVKWLVPESLSDVAASVLEGPWRLCAPDLLFAEVGNVLWKKTRRCELTRAESAEALDTLLKVPFEIFPLAPLVPPAFELAASTGSTVYDCTYLVLAASLRAQLVTADRRFLAIQRRGPLRRYIRLVDEAI